jgi:hypothetical protein
MKHVFPRRLSTSNVPGLFWLTVIASCKAWASWTPLGAAGSTSVRAAVRTYRVPICFRVNVWPPAR